MIHLAFLVYSWLLQLYPRHFRAEFEAEMLAVFQEKAQEQAALGRWPLLVVLWQELRDWPANCLQAHWQGAEPVKLIKTGFKWITILLLLASLSWIALFVWFIGTAEA